jgi:hypothetical protein
LTTVKDSRAAALPSTAVSSRPRRLADRQGGRQMASDPRSHEPENGEERVPFMQKVLDNPFLLLFLGVTMPTVFYLIWGIMEVANIPIAK